MWVNVFCMHETGPKLRKIKNRKPRKTKHKENTVPGEAFDKRKKGGCKTERNIITLNQEKHITTGRPANTEV